MFMWAISWTNFPSPHSLVHGQRWCAYIVLECLLVKWMPDFLKLLYFLVCYRRIEYGRCMAGAPPTHHLLYMCLSLPPQDRPSMDTVLHHIKLWVLVAATVLIYIYILVCSLHKKASSLGKLNLPVVLLPYVPSSTGVKLTSLRAPLKVASLGQCTYCVCV